MLNYGCFKAVMRSIRSLETGAEKEQLGAQT